jgi:hypothetical protein
MQSNYFDDHSQGVQLSTHEGGHNLGLGHAASRDFGNEALGAPGVAGTYSEYGDNFSAMGFWNFGHYAAPHKVKLGWLTNYLTVTGNGSFAVQPMEFDGNLQALKIQRGTDSSKFIWMEYRQSNGLYDSALNSQVFGGGLVHYQDATIYKTNLLDFTPATATFSDAVLAGKWTDPYTSLTIEASNPTSSSLNVNVYYGSVPCVTSPPSVTLSPLNPSGYEGGNVNYTVTVTNNDTSSCDPRSFTMSSLIPGSWPTTFTQGVLSIPAASRASTGMTKTIPEGTSAATYSVDAVAASSENSATASANLTVMPVPPPPPPPAPLSITVTATPLRNSVTISSRTTQGTLPVSGATVVFTMIAPNGASTRKATTDSSGNASWNFKVNPKTVKGSYMVTAQATLGSQTATSAAATFVVQ